MKIVKLPQTKRQRIKPTHPQTSNWRFSWQFEYGCGPNHHGDHHHGIMAFKGYREPTEPLFKDFKILDFDKYRELHVAKFMWKLSKNEIPISISKLFKKQTSRNVLNLQLPTINTNHKKRFVSYSGIKVWNSVPDKI